MGNYKCCWFEMGGWWFPLSTLLLYAEETNELRMLELSICAINWQLSLNLCRMPGKRYTLWSYETLFETTEYPTIHNNMWFIESFLQCSTQ